MRKAGGSLRWWNVFEVTEQFGEFCLGITRGIGFGFSDCVSECLRNGILFGRREPKRAETGIARRGRELSVVTTWVVQFERVPNVADGAGIDVGRIAAVPETLGDALEN